MRLNYDCIRDILIFIADNQRYELLGGNKAYLKEMSYLVIREAEGIAGVYNTEDFWYSLNALEQMDYITVSKVSGGKGGAYISYDIKDITVAGHEFLNTLKNPTIWQASVAHVERFAGSKTLSALMTAGKYFIHMAITNPAEFQTMLQTFGI